MLLGAKYGTAIDLWSLACVVFELVTGDLLFDPRYVQLSSAQLSLGATALRVGCMPCHTCTQGTCMHGACLSAHAALHSPPDALSLRAPGPSPLPCLGPQAMRVWHTVCTHTLPLCAPLYCGAGAGQVGRVLGP